MKSPWLAFGLLTLILTSSGSAVAQNRARQTRAKQAPPPARAQSTQEPAAPPMPLLPDIRNQPDVQDADVAIVANITIKELRFDAVPNPKVEFLGKDKTTTLWHADRYNLPDRVEPGVTYRNVGIQLKIISTLADIDRIVSEALGEIPITDDVKETVTPAAPQNNSKPKPATATPKP